MRKLQLQQKQKRRVPIWRKTLTVGLLPIITFLWITGWILTQIESQERPTKIRQKTMTNHPELETQEKESQTPDEYSKIAYEPEIIA